MHSIKHLCCRLGSLHHQRVVRGISLARQEVGALPVASAYHPVSEQGNRAGDSRRTENPFLTKKEIAVFEIGTPVEGGTEI